MAIENFSWLLLDIENAPVLNANPLPTIALRRLSDNYSYDWSSNEFKQSGWIVKDKSLTRLDLNNFEGVYETSLDLSGFDGRYYAYLHYSGVDSVQNIAQEFDVFDGVVRHYSTGLTQSQEAKVDAIPTSNSVADIAPVLSAISSLNNISLGEIEASTVIAREDTLSSLTVTLDNIPTFNSSVGISELANAVSLLPTTNSDTVNVNTIISSIVDNKLTADNVWRYTR